MGPPKHKHVFLQENGKRICWKELGGGGSGGAGGNSGGGNKYIVIKEITSILEGRQTKKFKRFKAESDNQDKLSFSLITKKRTLDLEASNLRDKELFIANLQLLMKQIALSDPKKSTASLATNKTNEAEGDKK